MTNKTPQSVKAIEALKNALSTCRKYNSSLQQGQVEHDFARVSNEIKEAITALQSLDEKGDHYGLGVGHDKLCAKCGEKCNSLAGNPSLWPVIVHTACISPPATRAPDTLGDGWQPIETVPRDESLFLCRHKKKPHVTFEAAIFKEDDGWESLTPPYDVIQNMTADEPLDSDWDDLEWTQIPVADKAAMKGA